MWESSTNEKLVPAECASDAIAFAAIYKLAAIDAVRRACALVVGSRIVSNARSLSIFIATFVCLSVVLSVTVLTFAIVTGQRPGHGEEENYKGRNKVEAHCD